MLKKIAILLFATSLSICAAQASSPADRMLSEEQALSDINLMEEAYSRIHPGYTRYASEEEMAAAWERLRQVARGGITVGQFYIETQRALTVISCDHTKVELPRDLREDRNETPVYLPFKWTVISGRGFITATPEESPFSKQDEIIAIDGKPLATIMEEVSPLIPVDGYTPWARRGGIAQSGEFMGGAVDHFGALLQQPQPAVTVVVKKPDGQEITHVANRVTFDAYSEIKEPDQPARNFKDAVTFELIGDDAAYLRVDTFVNYRQPVSPDDIYDPIFDTLKTEQRSTLILDLRRNGGGSTDASNGLARRLITEKMKFVTEARVATIDHSGLEQYLSTWDERAINPPRVAFRKNDDGTFSLRELFDDGLKVMRPAKNTFTGNLIILTSNNNSSGSTNLIAVLKSARNATLVGEKSGGSPNGATAGVILTLTLPNSGVRGRIPVFRYVNNVKGFEDGYGITPDIAAPLTVKDFLAGKDPALDKAISLTTQ
ncbi:MAG: S41 family peptidase [Aquisalinus sp.]|nr:S41 family peptidase [Aquisalinus sp.]